MLFGPFHQDRPHALLPVPLLVFLLWPGQGTGGAGPLAAIAAAQGQCVWGMPLYQPLRWLLEAWPWAAPLLSLILIVGVGVSLTRMTNDNELHTRRNRFSLFLVPVCLALLPFGLYPGPVLAGSWAAIEGVHLALRTTANQRVGAALFDAGLLVGVASLFYLPYAFLTVVIWATLAVTRPFNLREQLLSPIATAAMLLLGWGVVHFVAADLWDPIASLHFPATLDAPVEAHWLHRVILIAAATVFAVAIAIAFASVYSHSVMREKNLRASALSFCFAMALLALFAWWLDQRIPPALLAIPASLLITYPLLQARKRLWPEAALWSLFLLALWARWFG